VGLTAYGRRSKSGATPDRAADMRVVKNLSTAIDGLGFARVSSAIRYYSTALPLDRPRRLRRDVAGHPIDPPHLVDDPLGDAPQEGMLAEQRFPPSRPRPLDFARGKLRAARRDLLSTIIHISSSEGLSTRDACPERSRGAFWSRRRKFIRCYSPASAGNAIACDGCKDFRRLDQGLKGRAERPSVLD
jgi:hypothetical protein